MKNICIPTYTQNEKKYMIKHDATPIGIVYYNTMTFEGTGSICKKISDFYEKFLANFSKWIDIDFKNYAEKDYLSDSSPRKRFRYKPFNLYFTMSGDLKDQYFFETDIKITLFKKDVMISEKNIRHIWNLKNGNLHTNR